MQYYRLLRSILREKPHLRKCLIKCRHCQIAFLTHPRNAGRKDLRCPFGCRQVHRRQSAIERSIEYYRSPEGKIKKQYLNARRNGVLPEEDPDKALINGSETDLDVTIILHIQLTTSLIEGRAVGLKEVMGMIERILRQHSIDKGEKLPYRGDRDHAKPP